MNNVPRKNPGHEPLDPKGPEKAHGSCSRIKRRIMQLFRKENPRVVGKETTNMSQGEPRIQKRLRNLEKIIQGHTVIIAGLELLLRESENSETFTLAELSERAKTSSELQSMSRKERDFFLTSIRVFLSEGKTNSMLVKDALRDFQRVLVADNALLQRIKNQDTQEEKRGAYGTFEG